MKEVSDNAKFQVLHSHYNTTFNVIDGAVKQRGVLMRLVIIVLVLSALFAFWPSEFVETISQASSKEFGVSLNPDFFVLGSIAGTAVWFLLLVVIIEYTKKVVYIERQYEYINRVEKELRKQYGAKSPIFNRESQSYSSRKGQRGFAKWIRLSLSALFPAVLAIVVALNIGNEWLLFFQQGEHLLLLLMNSAVAVYIIVILVMYIASINKVE